MLYPQEQFQWTLRNIVDICPNANDCDTNGCEVCLRMQALIYGLETGQKQE